MSEYTDELIFKSAKSALPVALWEISERCREKGVPTMLLSGLNELCLAVKIKNPARVLELGTALGVSGTAMLLSCNCMLTTVEKNVDCVLAAEETFKKFGVFKRVTQLTGDTLETVKKISDEKFDFIFLDCNKAAYPLVYEYLKNMLNAGGVLLADNVLFRGYVEGAKETPKIYRTLVQKIDRFNQLVANDEDMITTVLNVGDGLLVAVKK